MENEKKSVWRALATKDLGNVAQLKVDVLEILRDAQDDNLVLTNISFPLWFMSFIRMGKHQPKQKS